MFYPQSYLLKGSCYNENEYSIFDDEANNSIIQIWEIMENLCYTAFKSIWNTFPKTETIINESKYKEIVNFFLKY